MWLVEEGSARLLTPGLCANLLKSMVWRSDNSGVLADATGKAVWIRLDGAVAEATPGYRHRITDAADQGAYLDQEAGRQVLVLTGSDLRKRISIPSNEHGGGYADIAVSPDGSRIAAFDYDQWLVVDRNGTVLKPWGPVPVGYDAASQVAAVPVGWTTDGGWIVLRGATDLFALRPDGSAGHALGTGRVDSPLGFGPGSQFVYDWMDPSTLEREVRLASAGGTGSQVVVAAPGFGITWSRAGGPIAFSGEWDGVHGVHAVTPTGERAGLLLQAGTGTVRYTQHHVGTRYFEAGSMAWSADGTKLLVAIC